MEKMSGNIAALFTGILFGILAGGIATLYFLQHRNGVELAPMEVADEWLNETCNVLATDAMLEEIQLRLQLPGYGLPHLKAVNDCVFFYTDSCGYTILGTGILRSFEGATVAMLYQSFDTGRAFNSRPSALLVLGETRDIIWLPSKR